jgi:hypothetical protein
MNWHDTVLEKLSKNSPFGKEYPPFSFDIHKKKLMSLSSIEKCIS